MKKSNCFSGIMIAVAAIGITFSIVGLFVPWFSYATEMSFRSCGLFEPICEIDFPIQLLQSFAIITLVLALAACILFVLHSSDVIKIKWAYRIIYAAIVTLFAVLTLIFTTVVAKEFNANYMGIPLMGRIVTHAGALFLPLGAIVTGIPLLFNIRQK